ncbi:von Willebrand factor type A domain-containing protein [Danxiaibacter flavus]|uniref:von Willebrand factor type A domain-containing protein n=1 Tax=Danxiaibacter flavus TaxID=3049108 RepID=A0ABV3ZNM5_9BACT|nr:von Willebrand factor type A domain-containing protein [Chitinophagaceae bacterium DXS]
MKRMLFLSFLLSMLAFAFTFPVARTITGTITGKNNQPLAGAGILLKGSNISTISGLNGTFKIVVPDNKAILIITYAGYQSKEVRVGQKNQLNISLKIATSQVQEINLLPNEEAKAEAGSASTPLTLHMKSSDIVVTGYAAKMRRAEPGTGARAYDNADSSWRYNDNFNTESYDHITDNPFLKAKDNPLSTFSIDVDAASYSNIRRFVNDGQLPPPGAVRIEEMVNYFTYQYPQPVNNAPFSVNTELAACPWNQQHKLLLIGLQGKKIPAESLPPANLVFLVDVSGSMDEPNKLPLVQSSLKLLTDQLRPQDKVALVVYAGNAGVVLPSTSGESTITIKQAIDQLQAGGSTAGGEGIQLAYKIARKNFIKNGNNRVILCTDGDFNVGMSSDDDLERLIEKEREGGVFLTVLGYGMGNYKDSKMQKLADKGNGNHAYIDGLTEARKVLVSEFGGTLFAIAKDVKLQIEFNPLKVQSYRLIGYENRLLAKEDFNNDTKDAGELGSGHTVTALYEVVPADVTDPSTDNVDPLRYQDPSKTVKVNAFKDELVNIRLRYKNPGEDVSKLLQYPLIEKTVDIKSTSANFRFASAVAAFGMLLRDSKYKGAADYKLISSLAGGALANDKEGYRKEFIQLVEKASALSKKKDVSKVQVVPVDDDSE